MKPIRVLLVAMSIFLCAIISAQAEVKSLRFYILDYLDSHQKLRIKRALHLWVDEDDIRFEDAGNFLTVVEIQPPQNKKLRIYKILKQLKDQRLTGRYASDGHLLSRTEVVAVGKVFRHEKYFHRFRYPLERPALWASDTEQMFLFEQSPKVDELQMMVNDKINREMVKGQEPFFAKDYPDVIVKGNIPAFDGHSPVIVLKEFGDPKTGLPKKKAKKQKRGLRRWIPFF